MLTTLNGIVLRERSVGESDKFLDVLTDAEGLIEVFAKGVKKQNSKNAPVTQLYCYSKFCLNESGGRYTLNSAEPIRTFFELSQDIEKFSLAAYFSEMILYVATEERPNNEVLRLILNCFHFLCLGNRDIMLLKATFELRLMSEIGLIPNLIGCCQCLKYTASRMQFDLRGGRLFCEDCVGNRSLEEMEPLDAYLLHCLRFIALTDMKQLFGLNARKEYLGTLCRITERFCTIQLGRRFPTLEFYKSIRTER